MAEDRRGGGEQVTAALEAPTSPWAQSRDTHVTVAATAAEATALRSAWDRLPTSHPDAALDYFLASAATRANVDSPYVVLVEHRGEPSALAVAHLERSRFECRLGYHAVYAPTLSVLRVAHGGIAVAAEERCPELVATLEDALRRGVADVLVVPAVRVGSALEEALLAIPRWRRPAPPSPWLHRRLLLPPTFDDLLALRDRKSRYNLRRDAARLEQAFPGEVVVELLREPEDFDRIFALIEPIAATTYQRALGAGFADTPERRALVRQALERGWFRAWVLSVGGAPVAFWQGNVVGSTFFSSSTGYDPAYAKHGVGTYVQLRMFQDLCADPEVEVVDFGWGDADYKARFGTEAWEERDLVVFAPSLRGAWENGVRTIVAGIDAGARTILARAGLTTRVKRAWRARLRSGRA
jgi:CelD/BcsL family acetyltransferase involved in cellulose biosynthesis